ncbi:MAG: ATP-binding cassette domain-containing protein [Hyphomicrobiaceae bacterium]|nr:MAG: ATP-binding cassette domain-containing protein [Hyphomicrobiaceae bacterium]
MQRALVDGSRAHRTPILPVIGKDLTVERGGRHILKAIDIEVGGTGTLVLIGPNGAGKSLLVRVLAGLVRPSRGEVTWAGRPPDRQRAPKVGFVFQRPVLLRRSALANVEYALAVAGFARSERADRASAALTRARLSHLAQTPARVLSGGEQQLLSIVRALATEPEILILDEPTSNLDPAATAAIEHLVNAVRAEGTRVVLITHDLGQARRLGDEVAFLHRGRLMELSPRDAFLAQPASAEARAFLRGEIVL